MALSDFIGYVKSLSPALFRLPLLGHVVPYDLSGQPLDAYVRPTTISSGASGPVWRRDKKGFYFGQNASLAAGGGAIVVPDSGAAPELQLVNGTILFTARNFQALGTVENNAYVLGKYDGGGTAYRLYFNAALDQSLTIYNGAAASVMTFAGLSGSRTVAIRITAGDKPKLFTDGTYRVDGNANFTPVVNDADLYLANSVSLASGSRRNDYAAFALFNDVILGRPITDQEIANLSQYWDAIVSIHTPKRTYFLPQKATDIVAPTPLAHLSGGISPGSLWLDSSGNGRDGTVSGRVSQTRSPERTCLSGYGTGNPLIQSAISFGYDAANWTLEFDFLARSTGGGGQGALFALTDGGVVRALLSFSGANTFSYTTVHAITNGTWTFSSGPYNVWHTLVIRHARSGLGAPTVELDGETLAPVETSTPVGALTASAAPRVNLLNTAALDADFDGCIDDFKIYDSLLANAESRALYLDKALSGVHRLANRQDWPVSVANVAVGGMAGPWRVLSGTHRWNDDGTRRRMLGVTAGYFASRDSSPQAFGAWYGRVSKGTDPGGLQLPLVGSQPSIITAAGYNGYYAYIGSTEAVALARVTAGAITIFSTTAAGAVAINTEYELFVTRRPRDGFFTVWIRGGAYATWTSLLTGTDNNHTTSNCLVGSVDAGGYLADVTLFPNGGTLLPTEL